MANLFSDWVCFSIAPVMNIAEEAYVGLHPSTLVSAFLAFNCCSTICEPAIVQKIGLRNAVVLGCVIMTLGCLIISGIPGLWSTSYGSLLVGTVFVGVAQPFFQCTPALLAANWFGANERTLATTIALQATQFGIAAAYIVGTNLVSNKAQLQDYFDVITLMTAFLLVGVVLHFKEKPPTPPSYSQQGKLDNMIVNTSIWEILSDIFVLFKTPGFVSALTSFVCSLTINVIVSEFFASMLLLQGHDQIFIGYAGALYQVMIVSGAVAVGYVVDQQKSYWSSNVACYAVTCMGLYSLSMAINRQMPLLTVLSVQVIGFFSGPIQGIAAETAVEITYPSDENTIVAVQQVFSNLMSAILVPVFHVLRDPYTHEYTASVNLIFILTVVCMVVHASFRPELKRSNIDRTNSEYALLKRDSLLSARAAR